MKGLWKRQETSTGARHAPLWQRHSVESCPHFTIAHEPALLQAATFHRFIVLSDKSHLLT
jgi:hypothetical protein